MLTKEYGDFLDIFKHHVSSSRKLQNQILENAYSASCYYTGSKSMVHPTLLKFISLFNCLNFVILNICSRVQLKTEIYCLTFIRCLQSSGKNRTVIQALVRGEVSGKNTFQMILRTMRCLIHRSFDLNSIYFKPKC